MKHVIDSEAWIPQTLMFQKTAVPFLPSRYVPSADIIEELGIGRILVAPQLSTIQTKSTLPELQYNMHLQQPQKNNQPN